MANKRLRAIQRIRDQVPLPGKVSDLFGNGHLHPHYIEHGPATRVLQAWHSKAAEKVSPTELGIKQAKRLPMNHNQLVHKHPWAVMWIHKGKRYKKKQTNLFNATVLRDMLIEAGYKNATVVSLCRSYYVPVELAGKLPRPWSWCPLCMKPRKYRRVGDQTAHVEKKVWNETKKRYEFKERLVALLACPMCGCTNRNRAYRKSNQPYEVRKFKQGAIRARRKTRQRYAKRQRR